MKKTIQILCLLLLTAQVWAQTRNIEEELYIQLSSNQLLVGETLHFSIFVNSHQTGKPSPLSKLAYIELFNASGKAVYQGKIIIKDGRGHGQFFINSTLSSGAYRLTGRTRWMKNFNTRFECLLYIVNPFEKQQPATSPEPLIPSLSFYPTSAQIITGLPNQVFYNAESPSTNTIVKAKLIDPEGNLMFEFTPSTQGTGKIIFTPKSSAKYKIALETSDGQFFFSELQATTLPGETMIIEETQTAFTLSIHSTDSDFIGNVTLGRKGSEIADFDVVNESKIAIAKKRLGSGLFNVTLKDEQGKVRCQRQLYVKGPKVNLTTDLVYGKRERVQTNFELEPGTYSVAVLKNRQWIDAISLDPYLYQTTIKLVPQPQKFLSQLTQTQLEQPDKVYMALSTQSSEVKDQNEDFTYAPEHKGEMITGAVLADSLDGTDLILSTHGKNHLAITKTDSLGHFTFTVPPLVQNAQAFVQRLDSRPISIKFDTPFLNQVDSLEANPMRLSKELVSEIVNTSIKNQIENAFYDVKKDTLIDAAQFYETFSTFDEMFYLDDYNRFSTLSETIIEIIYPLTLTQHKKEKGIRVRFGSGVEQSQSPPLILIDGVCISASEALNIKTNLIRSIGIITKKVFVGKHHYNGVISMHTIDRDLDQLKLADNNRAKIQISAPEKHIQYKSANFSGDPHTPDFRELLYWAPELNILNKGSKTIHFSTSDVEGLFQVSVSGFTAKGEPVHQVQWIKVLKSATP